MIFTHEICRSNDCDDEYKFNKKHTKVALIGNTISCRTLNELTSNNTCRERTARAIDVRGKFKEHGSSNSYTFYSIVPVTVDPPHCPCFDSNKLISTARQTILINPRITKNSYSLVDYGCF